MGGVAFETRGELRVEFFTQTRSVRREEVQRLVAIAEPPFPIRRLENEAVLLHQRERFGVTSVFT
jgi:hypothetical protein